MTNDTPTRPEPTLAVVTVSYNSGRYLAEFLASTAAATHDPSRIDGRRRRQPLRRRRRGAAHHRGRRRRLRRRRVEPGYGTAVNTAVAALPASVRRVLVSNPDVVLAPGSLDVLVDTATADRRIAAVGPAVLEPTGEVYPSARAVPSLRTGLGHALFANVWPTNPWTRRYHRDGQLDQVRTAAAGSRGRASSSAATSSTSSAASTPASSCTSRTSTSGGASAAPGSATCTSPRPRSRTSGAHSTRDSSGRHAPRAPPQRLSFPLAQVRRALAAPAARRAAGRPRRPGAPARLTPRLARPARLLDPTPGERT